MNLDLFEDTLPFDFPSEDGYEKTWDENLRGFHLTVPNGKIFYSEAFFNKKVSARSFEYFTENNQNLTEVTEENFKKIVFKNINWKHDNIKLFGKEIPLPRYTSWYGNQGKSYIYSGIKSNPNQWNKGLLYIKDKVEKAAGVTFNSVLLNWYRNGDDYLNWHSDDEEELGRTPTIASVSFGETRDFVVRKKDKSQKITFPLKDGSLLIMSGELQRYWEHSVPKRKKVQKGRINLTFRTIL